MKVIESPKIDEDTRPSIQSETTIITILDFRSRFAMEIMNLC